MSEEEKAKGLERRDILRTGVVGAGMAALGALTMPGKAVAAPVVVPGGPGWVAEFRQNAPTVMEVLYEATTGVILASCVNDTGKPKLSSGSNVQFASTFAELRMDLEHQEHVQTGIELGGGEGKYRVLNGRIVPNPAARRTSAWDPAKLF